jgi:acetyl esterase
MLRLLKVTRKPVVEILPIPEGRAALLAQTVLAGGRQSVGKVRDLEVAGLPARLYTPLGAPETGPLLVFLHGGGFMYGDLASHDAPCRFLCERADVRVLAVDYRLGPEHRFPAAYDDALAAYAWVLEHADEVGADVERLGVSGDSAGGNLAAGVAHAAARAGQPLKAAILIYPVTDRSAPTRSNELFGEGFYLSSAFMDLAQQSYSSGPDDVTDPRYSPGLDDVPDGLAPTWVFTAGFDPLRDEGEAYAAKLAAAGVEVTQRRFPDQIHGFLNVLLARSSRAATLEIAAAVRGALH